MLVVTLTLIDPPEPSSTGKTLLIATTRGVRRTALRYGGKPVLVVVNAFIRPDEQHSEKKGEIPKSKGLRKPHTRHW